MLVARRAEGASVARVKEVGIVGGGLAGLSLAVGLARRGVPVVVHEAGRYPRHRVCGEFISGVGERTLEVLGIADDLADARLHREGLWFREGRRMTGCRLPRAALGISRYRLDERLKRRLVASGGTVREGVRRRAGGGEGEVWAAGRRAQRGPWIGLKCHLRELELGAGLEMHLGSNGYLGLTEVEDGIVNACGLFRLERSHRGRGVGLWLEYLRAGGLDDLAGRLSDARVVEDSFLGVAGFELGWQRFDRGRCVVGDAEGMIPPFTGNGMSMAFESAELALTPLSRWSRGEQAWESAVAAIRRAARRRFRRRLGAARWMQSLLLHPLGQSGLERVSRLGMLPFRPMLSLVR